MGWTLVLIGLAQAAGLPRFEQLENGLQVVVLEDHALPLVSVQLWFCVGSAQDPPARPGLCHVVRTVFAHRDDSALRLRAAGVRFESGTGRDACWFASLLPPSFLAYVLKVESARMRRLDVDAQMLATGLQAAGWEYAGQVQDPDHIVMRRALAALFPDHPYQHPPRFMSVALKDLSPTAVNEFAGRWFVPSNAVLLIAGDVVAQDTLEQVRRRFEGLEWAQPPRRSGPRRLADEVVEVSLSSSQRPGVTLVWRTAALATFESSAFDVLMHRLCNPVDGRLYHRVQDLNCGSLRWEQNKWRLAGVVALSVDAPAETQDFDHRRVVEIIEEELENASQTICSEIEHNRARALARRDLWGDSDRLGDCARLLAEHEAVAGDALKANLAAARVDKVTVTDVQAAARALRGARRVVIKRTAETRSGQATADGLLPAIQTTSSSPIGGAAMFDRLAAFSDRVPAIASSTVRPAVTMTTCDGVTLQTCPLVGRELATIVTVRSADGLGASVTAFDWGAFPSEVGGDIHDLVVDYMSYHGVRLAAVGRDGFASLAHAERVASVIEWHERLMRASAAGGKPLGDYGGVRVVVVGDTTAESVRNAIDNVRAEGSPHSPTAPRHPSSAEKSTPGLHLTWQRQHDQEGVLLQLRIELFNQTEDGCPFGGLDEEVLALLLGRAAFDSPNWDAKHVPIWRSWKIGRGALQARAELSSQDWGDAVTQLWQQLRRLQTGGVPGAQVATALRLARAQRWISLDGGCEIAKALLQGRADPWDLYDSLSAEQLLARIRSRLSQSAVLIRVESRGDLESAVSELAARLKNADR